MLRWNKTKRARLKGRTQRWANGSAKLINCLFGGELRGRSTSAVDKLAQPVAAGKNTALGKLARPLQQNAVGSNIWKCKKIQEHTHKSTCNGITKYEGANFERFSNFDLYFALKFEFPG